MGHGVIAAILLLASWAAALPGADGSAEAFEKARRQAEEAAKRGGPRQAPARFPPKEALGLAASPEGALALWGRFSPVLRERMMRADKTVTVMVMTPLNGADLSASRARTGAQRGVALAQVQAACATFLSTPGVPLTAGERDLLAAYAAKVGEARQPAQASR